MSKIKYDLSRVPRELLEQYIRTHTIITGEQTLYPFDLGAQIRKAAEVPLRTQAEINRDIAAVVRRYADYNSSQSHDLRMFITRTYQLPDGEIVCADSDIKKLLSEETSD